MKKILITGEGSYIGTSFAEYMKKWPGEYHVDTVDMIDGSWRQKSFAGYDVVYHVAGIVHKKEKPELKELYFSVNRDIAIETAQKAKSEGVGHFIFMSSMSVYGLIEGVITPDTRISPNTYYGESKAQAEKGILALEDKAFSVSVLRPPMVYGKNCKGNFQSLLKLAEKLPVFPKIENHRSMIYIDNLCGFIKKVTDEQIGGILFPQNNEYISTCSMVAILADQMGKKVRMSKLLGKCVELFMKAVPKLQKAFGSLIYQDTEQFHFCYCTVPKEESIRKSV